jgi:adenosylcobinamide-phosphate synthase
MNSLVLHIWIALALDFLIGDPRWLPHPVRIIGRTAQMLEGPARGMLHNQRLAGIVVAGVVIGGTGLATWGLLTIARNVFPLLGDLVAIGILYLTLAAKDLAVHSRAVLCALEADDLPQARLAVARMVGRDTEQLDEPAIVQAAVESVAENTVDGVLAPLFFAVLFGPVGAMVYKAVNTLDSIFGYKNKSYLRFGWASARIDDAANYIPARLSVLFISLAAFFSGGRASRALRVGLRDARKHRSPNAGYPEAAFAGALGVQLGGPLIRKGRPDPTPRLGDPIDPLGREEISNANTLMFAATIVAALFMSGTRTLLEAALT